MDKQIKTYSFKVILEPDDDKWHAYCPVLEKYSASTWGDTRDEALKNINEVVNMVIDELIEDGLPIPEEPTDEVVVFREPRVAVTI